MTYFKKYYFILLCLACLISAPFSWAQLSVLIDNGVSTANVGDVVTGKVLITNTDSSRDINARLYVQDLTSTVAGEAYKDLEEASNDRSNLPWLNLSTTEILVPAATKLEVPFQIIVPNNSDIQGSYWGIIMVEGEPKLVVEADPNQAGSFGVQVISRHALNVITDIGAGFAELSFSNPQLAEDGTPLFQVDLDNLGNKIIRPETYLELYAETGDFIGRVDSSVGRVRPSNPKRIVFDLSTAYVLDDEGEQQPVNLAAGTYPTNLIADAGGADIFGVRYNLTIGSP